jgi:hypothetical protein
MIVNYIPNYHKFINKIKDHHIIGYARKSEGKEDDETHIRPLQDMVNRLRERNLTDSIYVSFHSSASEIISSRDMSEESKISQKRLEDVAGNTKVF